MGTPDRLRAERRVLRGASALVPGVSGARTYRRAWLRDDLVAGLLLTAMLVPQGMAYAALAGLPPETGLYATMVPLLAYALFGPSRILVLGPDSAVAPVVAAAIIPIAGADVDARMTLAAMLAVAVGVLMVAGAAGGLGFVADLISLPVRVGYLAGIAVTVIVEQLPTLLGIPGGDGVTGNLGVLLTDLDLVDPTTAALGLGTVAVIVATRPLGRRVPGILIAVVGATLAVTLLGLQDDVATIGAVPEGLPGFGWPGMSGWDALELAAAAAGVALIAFADTTILSRSYAARLGEEVDQNRELFALGTANVATGLFSGFPISSSSSRTPVAEAAGAKTQLTGVVAAVALGVVLVVATGLMSDVPVAALAGIVIVAVWGLIEFGVLRRLARVDRPDFLMALVCLLGVLAFGVLPGIGIAVGLSLVAFFWRVWHPYTAVLGRVHGRKGYHDTRRHPEGRLIPGLVLVRFDAPLFFANAGLFRQRVLRAARDAERPVRLVVAGEPITDVDSTSADMLVELHADLAAMGVTLGMAEVKGPVMDRFRALGLLEVIDPDELHPTIGAAVHAHVERTGADWVDWEDEPPGDAASPGP
jgi:high affinity sulfate transporter 1